MAGSLVAGGAHFFQTRNLAALGKEVLIAGATQEYTLSAPDMILQVVHDSGFDGTQPFPVDVAGRMFWDNRSPTLDAIDAEVRRITEAAGARFLNRRALVCDPEAQRCTAVTPDMQGVTYDFHHWTLAGAKYFGAEMAKRGWFAF